MLYIYIISIYRYTKKRKKYVKYKFCFFFKYPDIKKLIKIISI